MTKDEALVKIKQFDKELNEYTEAILAFAKTLPLVLKDHNMPHIASELERWLFAREATLQARAQWFSDNCDDIIAITIQEVKKNQ